MENRDRSNGVMGDAASPSDLLAAMYERHGGAIMRYMQRRLGDGPAEDAAAEVFVRAIARRGSYVAYRDSELPWLYGIAANVIADSRRAEARRLRALQQIAIRDRKQHADAPGSQVLDPDLVRALRRLSREDRETLLLVVWGEHWRREWLTPTLKTARCAHSPTAGSLVWRAMARPSSEFVLGSSTLAPDG